MAYCQNEENKEKKIKSNLAELLLHSSSDYNEESFSGDENNLDLGDDIVGDIEMQNLF